jgi:hypothetical protein
MKSFGVAALVAVASAVEITWAPETKIGGTFYRVTDWVKYNLIETTSMSWSLSVCSVYNEDNGKESFMLKWDLQAPILATDKVMFEVSFSTDAVLSDPATKTPTTDI